MATAQNESLLKNTRSMLRSVLLSAPRGVRARNLEAEYRGITGKIIPYRELGYKTLKEFMNTLQDVARLSTTEGEPVYYGVADSSTAHIAKMVAKQKKPPKKKAQPLYSSNFKQSRGSGHYKGQRGYSSYHRNTDQTRTGSHTVSKDTAYSTHMGIRTVSQVASQPERVVRIVDDDVKTVTIAGGSGAYATKSWKEGAMKVDIVGYVSNMELKDVELVQMSGYIQSIPEEHSYKTLRFLRTLLCSSPELIVGKGQSVMCHFFFSDWKYQQHQGPWNLKCGQKVLFYGKPWARTSAKFKESMALKVLYYELLTDRALIGDTVTKHDNMSTTKKNTFDISAIKSDAQSPKKSPVPRPAVNDAELEERIYEIVVSEGKDGGLYYDRTKVLYQKKYGHEFTDDKVSKMKSLRIEEPAPNYKILYPVKAPTASSSQPAAHPVEKSRQLTTSQPATNQSTASAVTMDIPTDELPQAVLPKSGEHLRILVTHVEKGPDLFYIHVYCDKTIKSLQCLEKMTEALNKIVSTFTDVMALKRLELPVTPSVFDLLKNSETLVDGGSVGQYCAALYKDNSWNRAVITETKLVKGLSKGVKQKSHIIQYIDYGNTASVTTDQLRKLPTEYWSIPIQAIPCTLQLVEDDEYVDMEAIQGHFSDIVFDKLFLIEVKSVRDEEILLVNMFQDGSNISVASLIQDLLLQVKPSLPEYVQPSFGDDGGTCCMDVLVTVVESPASFYVQFIGEDYSDKLAAMDAALEQYLTKNRPVILKSYEVNNLTLYIDDDQCNQRALLLSVDDDHVRIQLVDYGHVLTVTKDKLFTLPNKFWELPFQGRQCFLYECADFVDAQVVTEEFTAMAEDKQLIALIVDSSSSRLAVQLTTTDDVIINDLLKKNYCPLSELSPKLPEAGKATRAVVTNINNEGLLSLQLTGPGTVILKDIEEKINVLCNTKGSTGWSFVKRMRVGLRCVTKYENKYYRAEVTKSLPSVTEVEVNLVDYGKLVTVEKLKLKTINDDSVWSLPYQAITCCLDNLPPPKGSWTIEATDYLRQKCSDEVTIESTETSGSVKLYLQNSDDEEDVNVTLQSSPQLFGLPCEQKADEADNVVTQTNSGCHGHAASNDQLNTNRNSNVVCYQPVSSDHHDDEAFTIESNAEMQPDTFQIVKVTHTSMINNEFMVQLLSNEVLLEELTEQLQEYCNSIPSPYTTVSDLINAHHQYCAVKHNGQWYRCRLLDVQEKDILVTLVDYGSNVVTNINYIHCLQPSMVAIPTQAVSCLHYLSLKEGVTRPSEIIPGNLYHCFPYFRSKQCYVVSLVDCKTNAIVLHPSS